jgi:hypothetical protein
MNCKNCGHKLVKHVNPKNGKATYGHYNRYYFRRKAINHKWCSKCETEGKECHNPKPLKLLILLFFGLILINLVSATNITRQFMYLQPSPAEGDILNESFVGINVSIFEDYPSTNCTLYLLYSNKTLKQTMERDNHVCYQDSMDLINNTNYTAYITVLDEEGELLKSHELHFSTNYGELPCSIKTSYGVRNCVANWLTGASKSIIITLILICVTLLVIDYIKERNNIQR